MYGLKSVCLWAWWSRPGLAIPEGLPGRCIQFSLWIEYTCAKYISPLYSEFKGWAETPCQGVWLPGSPEILLALVLPLAFLLESSCGISQDGYICLDGSLQDSAWPGCDCVSPYVWIYVDWPDIIGSKQVFRKDLCFNSSERIKLRNSN